MPIVNDKYTGIFFPRKQITKSAGHKRIPPKSKTEHGEEVDVNKIQQELAETKQMLGTIIQMLKDGQTAPTIIYKEVAGATQDNTNVEDPFANVKTDVTIKTDNVESKIKVDEIKKDADDLDASISALEELL